MAGSSTTDVWAVGMFDSVKAGFQTLAEHWNGNRWTVVPTPDAGSGANALFAVLVLSPADAWAVGGYFRQTNVSLDTIQFEHTPYVLSEHWNGQMWSIVNAQNPGQASNYQQPAANPSLHTSVNVFAAVSASAPSAVWAVGHYWDGTANRTLAEYWNGQVWSVVPTPNISSEENILTGITTLSGRDAWATGIATLGRIKSTLIEHWNGKAWTVSPGVNIRGENNMLFGVAARSAVNVWVVGQYYSPSDKKWPFTSGGPLAEYWNGQSWQIATTQKVGGTGFANVFNSATLAGTAIWVAGSRDSASVHAGLIERSVIHGIP